MKKNNSQSNIKELEIKIEHLEVANEQLIYEIAYLDHLMRKIGFTHGLETVKSSAQEIISNDLNEDNL